MDKRYIQNKCSDCCGCGACVVTCPLNAITLIENEYGFLTPTIDFEKCVNCGKCSDVCSFNSINKGAQQVLKVYAAALKDYDIIKNSASGGVFAGIAKFVLQKGGIVYGAAYRDGLVVEHIGIERIEDLPLLQGSKYLQSKAFKVFKEIKLFLDDNRLVLFSGTPCQVSALKSYLKSNYDNLLTIDIICHGVGSNKMFVEDIRCIEAKYKVQAETVNFRSKREGWGSSGEIVTRNKIIDYNLLNSPYYYYYYLENAILRDSCYSCRYAGEGRQGDFTVGDYWRIESAHPEINFDVKNGVSCILVNNDKGLRIMDEVKYCFYLINSDLDKIKSRNGQLVRSADLPRVRGKLFELYKKYGYKGIISFYESNHKGTKLLYRVKKNIPYKYKVLIKNLFRIFK